MCCYLPQSNYYSDFFIYNIGCKVVVSFLMFSPRWKGPFRHYQSKDSEWALCFPFYWLDAKHIFSKQHIQRSGKVLNYEKMFYYLLCIVMQSSFQVWLTERDIFLCFCRKMAECLQEKSVWETLLSEESPSMILLAIWYFCNINLSMMNLKIFPQRYSNIV